MQTSGVGDYIYRVEQPSIAMGRSSLESMNPIPPLVFISPWQNKTLFRDEEDLDDSEQIYWLAPIYPTKVWHRIDRLNFALSHPDARKNMEDLRTV